MRIILICLLFVSSVSSALQTRDKLLNQVTPFVQSAEVSYEPFLADPTKKIGVVTWKGTDQEKTPLLIIPGRGEIGYQWAENAFDTRRMGFAGDIKVWDPPGQGLSDRLIPNDPEVGHIDRYQDYDISLLDYLRRLNRTHRKPVVIAHSMGGMIIINTLVNDDSLAKHLILDAPMLDIHLSNHPALQYFENGVLEILNRLDLLQGFVVGRSGGGHPTTSDRDRKEYRESLQAIYNGHVPAKTLHWAAEANRGIKNALDRAHQIKIPITLFVAGNDHVIDPDGAKELQRACSGNCELIRVAGSEHAIHEEMDSMRIQILQKLAQILDLNCDGILRSDSRSVFSDGI
jgi:lysophospholipase